MKITLPNLKYKDEIKHVFIEKQIKKMKEELQELENYRDDDNLVEEVLDIMQLSISILKNIDLNEALVSERHFRKLINRGWQFENWHTIDIKKDS